MEKMTAEKSKKMENICIAEMLGIMILHIIIFAISAFNIFAGSGDRMLGFKIGTFAGIPTLVLFVYSYAVYMFNRNAPQILIAEGEENFELLSGKEYCSYNGIKEIIAKPFMGADFGSIKINLNSGESYKIKSVANVLKVKEQMEKIIEEKKNTAE